MKKIISAVISAAMLISISACASVPAASSSPLSSQAPSSTAVSSNPPSSSGSGESSGQGLEVDKGLLDVTITFPASMFQDGISDEEIKSTEAKGIKVTKNADGSITYTMSKATHQKLVEDVKKSTAESLDKLGSDGDYASISDVAYNDDFSQISIKVNKEKYESSLDSFAALNAGFQGMFYQLFDGKKEGTMKVKVDFIDEKTGDVLDSVTYPDALNDSSDKSK